MRPSRARTAPNRGSRRLDGTAVIDDMIGGDVHDDCTEFTDNGWTYERCW